MNKKNNASIDATALLEKDHRQLRKLLTTFSETTTRGLKKRQELLTEIAEEIFVHSQIEEEIFYPAYREAARTQEDAKLFFEATEEHGLVDVHLATLEQADPGSDVFSAKAKVLKDLIEHHAEEEETEMFPRARKLLGKARLAELGAEMQRRKEELQNSASIGGTR